eukprot:8581884-Pyramimonas_sp.AAC.2
MQEKHFVRSERISETSEWSLRRWWRSLWGPASPGEGSGSHGGMAIFTRAPLGLRENLGLHYTQHPFE